MKILQRKFRLYAFSFLLKKVYSYFPEAIKVRVIRRGIKINSFYLC